MHYHTTEIASSLPFEHATPRTLVATTSTVDKPEILETPLPNPSIQVTADHRLKKEDAPVYAPKAGEVLVHVKATGVCG